MLRFFILIVFILICPLYADTYEEFYILPMGQGNSQLVIYAQGSEKIGVLYDLGSKSILYIEREKIQAAFISQLLCLSW